jgi:hypothetical protein
MEESGQNEGAMESGGYAYFVVRVTRGPPARGALGGLVERLGTGEKRAFATAAELIDTLSAWVGERPRQP